MNADFDLLVVPPDLALTSNGFYDAQALRNAPSFADPFKVRFVWLGTAGTSPGAQPVTVYNADFSTQSQGQTVPEPSTLVLLVAAASLLARRPRNGVFPKRRPHVSAQRPPFLSPPLNQPSRKDQCP